MTDRRLALVITVDRHDNPGLRDLLAPSADAKALADVLGSPDLGGFDLEFLHNPTSWTTYEKVDALLADRRPSDLVLLHFSGHGLKDLDGELYLATTNTVPDRLASTAVETAWINRMMQRSRAQRVVLLLDCCYGGAFERGVLARTDEHIDVGDRFRPNRVEESRGRVVITASTAMEYAFESAGGTNGAPARPSVFTGALAEGIRTGDADRDQDGYVALDELYDYVYDRVRERSRHQTPCKWEFGLRGDLYVARNPNRQPVASALPAEVLDLIDHPTAAVRLAAVHELTDLANGRHPARSAAARTTLARLADDDSRRVSAAAAEALSRTIPPPSRPNPSPPTVQRSLRRPTLRPIRRRAAARSGLLLGAGLVVTMVAGLTVNATGQTHPPSTSPSAAPVAVTARPAVAGLIRVGGEPEGVAVSPDGAAVYVADQGSRSLFLIDPAQRRVRAEINLPSTPRFVALSLSGDRAYVSMYADDGSGSGVAVLDTRTATVLGVVPTGSKPYTLAVAPDGRVWVPVHGTSRIQVIDGNHRTTVADVAVPPNPHAVAFSADGRRAYTPDHESNLISVIDGSTHIVLAAIKVGKSPHHLAVSPDGRSIAVANYDAGTVNLVDTGSRQIRATIRVGDNPQSVGFTPDGTRALVVTEGDNAVAVVDVAARRVATTLRVGASPRSVAIAPDGRTAYVTNGDAGTLSMLKLA